MLSPLVPMRIKCIHNIHYNHHKILLYNNSIRFKSKAKAQKLIFTGEKSKWMGKPRSMPGIVYQIPFIISFGFIFYVSFDWIAPYIKPGMFDEAERRQSEKLLLRIDQYLDWNAQREDIIQLLSGLQFKKINRKSVCEKKPSIDDTVMIHYQGQYMNGEEFDNSIEKNRPVSVKVSNLIDGLREGIQYMNEGDSYEFYIHPKLGYGYQALNKAPGEVGIKENSVLIYSVKLLKILGEDEDIEGLNEIFQDTKKLFS